MEQSTVISVSALREATNRLLDLAELQLGPDIELGADYYWDLNPADAYGVDRPTEQWMSQLSDDVAEVAGLLARDPDEPLYLWHDLAHVVGILRRIAAMDLPDGT